MADERRRCQPRVCDGRLARRRVGVGWAHECVGVPEHIQEPRVMDALRRIEVSACG